MQHATAVCVWKTIPPLENITWIIADHVDSQIVSKACQCCIGCVYTRPARARAIDSSSSYFKKQMVNGNKKTTVILFRASLNKTYCFEYTRSYLTYTSPSSLSSFCTNKYETHHNWKSKINVYFATCSLCKLKNEFHHWVSFSPWVSGMSTCLGFLGPNFVLSSGI